MKKSMMKEPQLSTHVWLVMMKAFQALREHDLKSIEATGLGLSDFGTLEILLHKGPLPVNGIGDRIMLTSGSITATVDRLERKKLVERKSSDQDRRVRMVHLTPDGKKLIEKAFKAHQQTLHRATSGLSGDEKLLLCNLLKKMGKEANRLLLSDK